MSLREQEIIKTKAEFVKENAITLYFMSGYKAEHYSDYTIEENLLSILLSDKPLILCPRYQQLQLTLLEFDPSVFVTRPGENYALKTIFSAARYLNSSVRKDKTGIELRDRLRKYCQYLDNYTLNNSEVKLPETARNSDIKIKMKRGI